MITEETMKTTPNNTLLNQPKSNVELCFKTYIHRKWGSVLCAFIDDVYRSPCEPWFSLEDFYKLTDREDGWYISDKIHTLEMPDGSRQQFIPGDVMIQLFPQRPEKDSLGSWIRHDILNTRSLDPNQALMMYGVDPVHPSEIDMDTLYPKLAEFLKLDKLLKRPEFAIAYDCAYAGEEYFPEVIIPVKITLTGPHDNVTPRWITTKDLQGEVMLPYGITVEIVDGDLDEEISVRGVNPHIYGKSVPFAVDRVVKIEFTCVFTRKTA
jgi:hypothetical protein